MAIAIHVSGPVGWVDGPDIIVRIQGVVVGDTSSDIDAIERLEVFIGCVKKVHPIAVPSETTSRPNATTLSFYHDIQSPDGSQDPTGAGCKCWMTSPVQVAAWGQEAYLGTAAVEPQPLINCQGTPPTGGDDDPQSDPGDDQPGDDDPQSDPGDDQPGDDKPGPGAPGHGPGGGPGGWEWGRLCPGLIVVWFAAYVAAWVLYYLAMDGAAGASMAASAVALVAWATVCCRKCMSNAWSCCTFIRWMILAHQVILTIYGVLAGTEGIATLAPICSELGAVCAAIEGFLGGEAIGNTIAWWAATIVGLIWSCRYVSAKCRGRYPVLIRSSTWPKAKC